MCADDREQRVAEPAREEDATQFAPGELGNHATVLGTSAAMYAELEREGEAVLNEQNDDWVAEGLATRQGLESWKVREDYQFDGSLAQRVADEGSSAFAGFPDDEPTCSDTRHQLPESSSMPPPSARSERPRFTSALLLGSPDPDSDDSDDDGLFSVADKNGKLQPASAAAAAAQMFTDDDL